MRLLPSIALFLLGCPQNVITDKADDTGAEDPVDTDTDVPDTDSGTVVETIPAWCVDRDLDSYLARSSCLFTDPENAEYYGIEDFDAVTDWDCNDNDAAISPQATEDQDNGIDDNCDGTIDESPDVTKYLDADGDGYGSDIDFTAPVDYFDSSWVSNSSDCDDGDANVTTGDTFYADADGDTFGDEDATTGPSCTAPAGYVDNAQDCDDTDGDIHPGAEPQCEVGVDADCDGHDDSADADSDGYAACLDCDDTNATVYPYADEYCDGEDDDCDGRVDENDAVDAATWYEDDDSDGYGDSSDTEVDCVMPEGFVGNDEDCDDSDAGVSPDGREVCDTVDNDCDGDVDDDDPDVEDQTVWYYDDDGDGYGSSDENVQTCSEPSGDSHGSYVDLGLDCDENDRDINPAAIETVGDGVDSNCSGGDDI